MPSIFIQVWTTMLSLEFLVTMSRLESVLVDPVICATDVLRHGTRSDPNPSLKPPRQMEVCDVDWIKQTQQCPARSTFILQSTCNDTILARKKKTVWNLPPVVNFIRAGKQDIQQLCMC